MPGYLGKVIDFV